MKMQVLVPQEGDHDTWHGYMCSSSPSFNGNHDPTPVNPNAYSKPIPRDNSKPAVLSSANFGTTVPQEGCPGAGRGSGPGGLYTVGPAPPLAARRACVLGPNAGSRRRGPSGSLRRWRQRRRGASPQHTHPPRPPPTAAVARARASPLSWQPALGIAGGRRSGRDSASGSQEPSTQALLPTQASGSLVLGRLPSRCATRPQSDNKKNVESRKPRRLIIKHQDWLPQEGRVLQLLYTNLYYHLSDDTALDIEQLVTGKNTLITPISAGTSPHSSCLESLSISGVSKQSLRLRSKNSREVFLASVSSTLLKLADQKSLTQTAGPSTGVVSIQDHWDEHLQLGKGFQLPDVPRDPGTTTSSRLEESRVPVNQQQMMYSSHRFFHGNQGQQPLRSHVSLLFLTTDLTNLTHGIAMHMVTISPAHLPLLSPELLRLLEVHVKKWMLFQRRGLLGHVEESLRQLMPHTPVTFTKYDNFNACVETTGTISHKTWGSCMLSQPTQAFWLFKWSIREEEQSCHCQETPNPLALALPSAALKVLTGLYPQPERQAEDSGDRLKQKHSQLFCAFSSLTSESLLVTYIEYPGTSTNRYIPQFPTNVPFFFSERSILLLFPNNPTQSTSPSSTSTPNSVSPTDHQRNHINIPFLALAKFKALEWNLLQRHLLVRLELPTAFNKSQCAQSLMQHKPCDTAQSPETLGTSWSGKPISLLTGELPFLPDHAQMLLEFHLQKQLMQHHWGLSQRIKESTALLLSPADQQPLPSSSKALDHVNVPWPAAPEATGLPSTSQSAIAEIMPEPVEITRDSLTEMVSYEERCISPRTGHQDDETRADRAQEFLTKVQEERTKETLPKVPPGAAGGKESEKNDMEDSETNLNVITEAARNPGTAQPVVPQASQGQSLLGPLIQGNLLQKKLLQNDTPQEQVRVACTQKSPSLTEFGLKNKKKCIFHCINPKRVHEESMFSPEKKGAKTRKNNLKKSLAPAKGPVPHAQIRMQNELCETVQYPETVGTSWSRKTVLMAELPFFPDHAQRLLEFYLQKQLIQDHWGVSQKIKQSTVLLLYTADLQPLPLSSKALDHVNVPWCAAPEFSGVSDLISPTLAPVSETMPHLLTQTKAILQSPMDSKWWPILQGTVIAHIFISRDWGIPGRTEAVLRRKKQASSTGGPQGSAHRVSKISQLSRDMTDAQELCAQVEARVNSPSLEEARCPESQGPGKTNDSGQTKDSGQVPTLAVKEEYPWKPKPQGDSEEKNAGLGVPSPTENRHSTDDEKPAGLSVNRTPGGPWQRSQSFDIAASCQQSPKYCPQFKLPKVPPGAAGGKESEKNEVEDSETNLNVITEAARNPGTAQPVVPQASQGRSSLGPRIPGKRLQDKTLWKKTPEERVRLAHTQKSPGVPESGLRNKVMCSFRCINSKTLDEKSMFSPEEKVTKMRKNCLKRSLAPAEGPVSQAKTEKITEDPKAQSVPTEKELSLAFSGGLEAPDKQL
ncbi:protein FAM205A-like [Elephas maximus indicus]|uniref:protein FAM205A-like n=1 Tax=Elephas maximus indicus TaxID=99487 RepID=UPI002115CE00|nr:protein FAM205A-like [Elephas maximus indicus]XP_049709033.1 protein FAM205A-like [Elephas maximus indicus]